MPSIENNKQFVLSFIDAMSRGDAQAIADSYTDNGVLHTLGNTLISGQYSKEQIRAFAGSVLESFPSGLKFSISGITAEGNRVAVEASSEGEHVSGAHYSNRYHFLFELENGRIAVLREYMDTETVTEILCGGQRPASNSAQ